MFDYKKPLNTHKMPYREKALEKAMNRFKWKSETLKLPLSPEFYLNVNGSIGYNKRDNKWVVGTFNGILDEYGDFMTYICHSLNTNDVKTFELKNHEEVIVCGNTSLYRPFNQERDFFAFMKEEADVSILSELLNTRLNKAFIAESDQQRKQIIKAYKDVVAGLPLIVVTSLLEGLDTVDLTDPQSVDKIQYLTSFYQSLEKREANNNGVDLEALDKKAQVSTTEITQYDDVTTEEYLIMYEKRLDFVKEMKENGYNLEIVRNPVYFDEPEKEDIEKGTFEQEEQEEQKEEQEEKQNDNEND